ncbi:hypothetical protein LTY59_07110 [Limosilactobacillus balticus]|uniref:Uncharacterized protein n=1 Tax=Limosilactobacillus balticus TaxID=2759747 RepID=A0ABS8RDD1_9LACO|nr:hypothetical protein [Limosilactobacillus balticus]MBB1109491.1 hypothetical protein [Limosilactobacillus balticus]MCD7138988.1 hypothetical protein [Limosilactobacillus balticus]
MTYYKEAYLNDHKQILIVERDLSKKNNPLQEFRISPFKYYTWPIEINKNKFSNLNEFLSEITKGQNVKDKIEAANKNDFIIWPLKETKNNCEIVISKSFDDETIGVCWITKSKFRKTFRVQRITKSMISLYERIIKSDLSLYNAYISDRLNKYRYKLLNNNKGPILSKGGTFYGGNISHITDMYKNGLAVSANAHAKDGNWKPAKIKAIYY